MIGISQGLQAKTFVDDLMKWNIKFAFTCRMSFDPSHLESSNLHDIRLINWLGSYWTPLCGQKREMERWMAGMSYNTLKYTLVP